jgi:crotonobetainyl-CoA:carnitine CoA-transferase CaiB-like acyl-CoA transferase
MSKPLANLRVLSLAINLPGPLAVAQLCRLGATVTKIEPPEGDPLARASRAWYEALHAGLAIVSLNLREEAARSQLDAHMGQADLLVTASRRAALERLRLGWTQLHVRYPRLCQVAIVGYPSPNDHLPGHDLTYQAQLGLLTPPNLPRICLADIAGAQEAVSAALTLLLARERSGESGYAEVSLASAAGRFVESLRFGLTTPSGLLGGGDPGYDLYPAGEGWIALAALERRFRDRLVEQLELPSLDREALRAIFKTRPALEWEKWAAERDLPLVAVREAVAGAEPT